MRFPTTITLKLLKISGALLVCFNTLSADAADLVELLRKAQAADAGYSAARASWQAAQEKLPQGLALLLPSASLSANTQYNDRTIDFRNNTSTDGRFNSNSISSMAAGASLPSA